MTQNAKNFIYTTAQLVTQEEIQLQGKVLIRDISL